VPELVYALFPVFSFQVDKQACFTSDHELMVSEFRYVTDPFLSVNILGIYAPTFALLLK